MFNIGITTYNRFEYVSRCIDSIIENTEVPYRLFVYDDASPDDTARLLIDSYGDKITQVIANRTQRGITLGFDTLWLVSQHFDYYYDDQDFPYFCYIQDDTVVAEKGWLKTLKRCYDSQSLMSDYRIGLFSGHHAPEHPTVAEKEFDGTKVLIKPSMRATNMIASYEFWDRIGLVPRLNPDGSERGFPGPPKPDGGRGRGSNMDVYITGFQSKGTFVPGAAAETCSWKLGTYCMVVPGLVKHMALSAESSTWGNPNKEV